MATVPILNLFGKEEIISSNFSSERIFGNAEESISMGVTVMESKIFVDVRSPGSMIFTSKNWMFSILPSIFEIFDRFNIFVKTGGNNHIFISYFSSIG